ncbi:MAG: hypothetical protein IPF82_16460 [Blastocatellia bacterium]|nr:hypothetical protein [Blastocatellia bacterium]
MTVEFELVEGLPSVRGDRIQLQQVVLNLVVNGISGRNEERRTRKQRLTIRTLTTDRQTASLEVCDSGIGIDVTQLDQVFQPYFTTKRDGLGMGLSIARSIVRGPGSARGTTLGDEQYRSRRHVQPHAPAEEGPRKQGWIGSTPG